MTRINVIPVTELCDQHLLAEYRELPRVFKLARDWLLREGDPNAKPSSIPDHYVLGKGHVSFFYDKLLWCFNRMFALYGECKARGFDVKYDPAEGRASFFISPEPLFNDYTPTPEALALNRARIAERLSTMEPRYTNVHS